MVHFLQARFKNNPTLRITKKYKSEPLIMNIQVPISQSEERHFHAAVKGEKNNI